MVNKNACVPGFVSKLWTLVDSPSTNDVICWSSDGTNFRILEEERFTKEILPKYFKHNNLSSFIRQLNMYGFRKVLSVEGGLVKPKNLNVLEFHHMYFQKGKEDLLEYIKRKVSSVRTEDAKISQEDMYKVLEDVQLVRGKQEDMDGKLENMKRENEILWKEVSALRRKHSLQQRTLTKVIQFFVSLVQGNCVFGIKKKRPLMIDMSEGPPAKISKPLCVLPKDGASVTATSGNKRFSNTSSSNVTIVAKQCNIIDKTGQETANIWPDELDCPAEIINPEVTAEGAVGTLGAEANVQSLEQTSSLQGEGVGNLGDEILDSILAAEDTLVAPYQSEVALNRVAIQDHINGIDSAFEELQAFLQRKQFNMQPEFISNLFNADLLDAEMDMPESTITMGPMSEWPDSNIQDEELVLSPGSSKGNEMAQCTPSHVLTLLDELCSSLGMEKSQVEEPPLAPRAESCPPEPLGNDLATHIGQPTG